MPLELLYDAIKTPIEVDLTNWLAAYGLDIANHTDAIWMIKLSATDDDAAALYVGTEANDGLAFVEDKALLYLKDFKQLTPGRTYRFGFGLRFPGDERFREVAIEDNTLKIVQDFIRA
ncbi:MAG: hypothetical protein F6J87_14935 [Spirulina sp. SIO3F2]|nr:hypothetical protein [Spirulina sp. SIO3F2]